MPQLSEKDIQLVDKVLRQQKGSPADALRRVNAAREVRDEPPIQRDAIYRYMNGKTHRRGRQETRGSQPILSKADVRNLMQTRRRLLKESDETRVT